MLDTIHSQLDQVMSPLAALQGRAQLILIHLKTQSEIPQETLIAELEKIQNDLDQLGSAIKKVMQTQIENNHTANSVLSEEKSSVPQVDL